ncbi:MAG: DUF1949 domain-containing protein, partial [Candidatus Muirbacterium halophilum]|nr:DUF1949 domain-containing protein [Candidatus Muirbacterium halophilum]
VYCDYSFYDSIKKTLENFNADIIEEIFTDKVEIKFNIDLIKSENIKKALIEISNDNIIFLKTQKCIL